jgi:peptidoglycan/xylan/chitin deacetylase (PgdA/CDA1 family)
VDPWGLALAPDRFAAQLEVLRAPRRSLPLSTFVDHARRGRLAADAIAITFDDGYGDTRHAAEPRLGAAGLPATVFVATAFVGQPFEYWWDELARGILERDAALDVEIAIGGAARRLTLPAVTGAAAEGAAWRAADPPSSARAALYYDVWERLRLLPAPERQATMAALREALRLPPPRAEDLPMTAEEVAALAAGGLIAIGGHTATHPMLTRLDPAERRQEIAAGKRVCERLTRRPVDGFAYPFGANDVDARAAVAESGFLWACTTEARPVAPAEPDWFGLPRIAVPNLEADAFERALWMASA